MVPGTFDTQNYRPHAVPAAGRSKESRAGRVAAVTVGVPVGVFAAGFGLARDARVTAWVLLVLLVGSGCYGIVRWVLRVMAGQR